MIEGTTRFGGTVSVALDGRLLEATRSYADSSRAESLLLEAHALDSECLPVYFALYKSYFYSGRLADAERIVLAALAFIRLRLGRRDEATGCARFGRQHWCFRGALARGGNLRGVMIDNDILGTIGRTPTVRNNRLAPTHVTMYVKCEFFNPLSSVKDRLAIAIIEDAQRSGERYLSTALFDGIIDGSDEEPG